MKQSALILLEAPRAPGLTAPQIGTLSAILFDRIGGIVIVADGRRDIDLRLNRCPFCQSSPAFFALHGGQFYCPSCDTYLRTEEDDLLEAFDVTRNELERRTLSNAELRKLGKTLKRNCEDRRRDGFRRSYTLQFYYLHETGPLPNQLRKTELDLVFGVFWCREFGPHFASCHHFGSAHDLAVLGAAPPTP